LDVSLIDKMGTDLTVVNSARVSFASESKELDERGKRLIRYLSTHNHFTPFTHVQIQMREKVPLFVARQRFKHTVGFTYNERSGRYVGRDVEFFTPT
jgi:thymidylate synthase (FAD)